MGYLSNIISTIGSALGIKKKEPTQLGTVYIKPSEVSRVGQGTRYEVPQTGERGVGGSTPTTRGTKNITSPMDLIPSGNIQESIRNGQTVTPSVTPALQTGATPVQIPQGTATTAGMSKTGKGNTITDAELAKLPMNQRPKMINSLTGEEMYAPQLTEEEKSLGSAYNIKATTTSFLGAFGTAALPAVFSTAAKAIATTQTYLANIGALASTDAGAATIASASPEAAGVASKTLAGEVASNTATVTKAIKSVMNILGGKNALKTTAFGYIIIQGFTSKTTVRKDVSDYVKDSGDLALKLRQAGMTEQADELYASNVDLLDGIDKVIPFIPLFGKTFEEGKIQNYRDELNRLNNEYETQMIADAVQTAADERIYKEQQQAAQRVYDEQQKEEQRIYNEQQKELDRAYAEKTKQEQRDYDEQQAEVRRQQELGLEATATQTAESSTLNFGILHTSGAKEFVNRSKAAQYYFQKSYEELTPEQQMLLNLLKGQ